MNRSVVSTIAMIGLAAFSFACKDTPPSPPGNGAPPVSRATASGSPGKGKLASSLVDRTKRTTNPETAVKNFLGQFKQHERILASDPKRALIAKAALAAYKSRLSWLGHMSALDRAVELGESFVELYPKRSDSYIQRASALGATHRFADAWKDLDEAKKLGAPAEALKASRAVLLAGLGKYDEALPIFRGIREVHASTANLALEAMCLGRMLRFDEADALFVRAEKKYRDRSPFILAWLYFERGSMWDRAGNRDKAIALYRAAVERLPPYAHAVGHLAQMVPPEEGKQLLEEIIKTSDDPEYLGLLSRLEERLAKGSGKANVDQAKAGYEALMKKHPLAFADHAGWFYLVIAGDSDKAVEVAELNFNNRKVPEAYELLIAALTANREHDEACVRAEEGVALKYASLGLKRVAAAAFDACGKKDRAIELRKELKSEN